MNGSTIIAVKEDKPAPSVQNNLETGTNGDTGNQNTMEVSVKRDLESRKLNTKKEFCKSCFKGKHSPLKCPKFVKLSIKSRKILLDDANLCENCLSKSHSSNVCIVDSACKRCDMKHHTLLHTNEKTGNALGKKQICSVCNEPSHTLKMCSVLNNFEGKDLKWVSKHYKLCYNCFSSDHSANNCPGDSDCSLCANKHNARLHNVFQKEKNTDEKGNLNQHSNSMSEDSSLEASHLIKVILRRKKLDSPSKISAFNTALTKLKQIFPDNFADLLLYTIVSNNLDQTLVQNFHSSEESKQPKDVFSLLNFVKKHMANKTNENIVKNKTEEIPPKDIIFTSKFLKLSSSKRYEFVRENQACIVCLDKGHVADTCSEDSACKKCGSKHHTLLHQDDQVIDNNGSTTFCAFCFKDFHPVDLCNVFTKLDKKSIKNVTVSLKLCFNCLSPAHVLDNCPQETTCEDCSRRHHTIVHSLIKQFAYKRYFPNKMSKQKENLQTKIVIKKPLRQQEKCKKCSTGEHLPQVCSKFLKFNVEQRKLLLEYSQLCENCFSKSHLAEACEIKNACKKCDLKHHTLVHSKGDLEKVEYSHICLLCYELDHTIESCYLLNDIVGKDLKQTLRHYKLCYNCMSSTHTVSSCPENPNCTFCKEKHYSKIHSEVTKKQKQNTELKKYGYTKVAENGSIQNYNDGSSSEISIASGINKMVLN